MSGSPDMRLIRTQVAIVTVSDRSFAGQREDRSGPALYDFVTKEGLQVVEQIIVPDEIDQISAVLQSLCITGIPLVLTTGGTGVGPRDITPEATRMVIEREIPGLAEEMRRSGMPHTRFALLSRAVVGVKGASMIINLPGSPKGAFESLAGIWDVLPHALQLLAGNGDGHGH